MKPDVGPFISAPQHWCFAQWANGFGRPLIDEYPRLDVRELQRAGLLEGAHRIEWSDGSAAELSRHEDEIRTVHQPAGATFTVADQLCMTWTPCHFGGRRVWLYCPLCLSRVAVLHAFPNFACRSCHSLAYASTNITPGWGPEPVVPVLMI